MFPAEVESFTTAGEEAVYRFLKNAARPDSEFLAWYSPDIEDREPDFILLSPDCGLIVLEVKDWVTSQILKLNPKDALLRIAGKPERRKQPLAQAREYVNSLMSLLGRKGSSVPGDQHKLPCPITWGAVFPHIHRDDFRSARMHEVMDETRVFCWDDICETSPLMRDKSGEKFRQWLQEHFPPLFDFTLTKSSKDRIRSSIFPVVRLDLPVRGGCQAQAETVLALDQDQENLARSFGCGKMLMQGPSGSGKTLILAHQAWNLLRINKSIKRILITCFNLSLVPYVRRLLSRKGASLGADGVEVLPFYSLCERILGEPMAHGESSDFYNLVVQETLDRLDGTHPLQNHWNAILVDEGQDFSKEMAQVILRLLPPSGTLTIAQDENQRLYTKEENAWSEIPGLRIHKLHRQYRNTKQIASWATKSLTGNTMSVEFMGADGPEPSRITTATGPELVQHVADAVATLIQQGVPMSEIAVLYAHSKIDGVPNLPEALLMAIEMRGALARWAAKDITSKRGYDITTDSVTISTIHSAKGLDYAHVFLLGLKNKPADDKNKRLAYVGMTRARESLTLCDTSQ